MAVNHWQIQSLDTSQVSESDKPPLQQNPAIPLPANTYFSLGIHPWNIQRQDINAAFRTLNTYQKHPNLLAIGECGLDKTIHTDLSTQLAVFQQQIELSERWHKPLVIHCVRAFNELIQLKKSLSTINPWIIHGYNNNPELAKQLLKHGCYLSLGKALLNQQSNATQTLRIMPLERLFLETDDADDSSISEIYSATSKITSLTVDTLRQQIFSNFERVFL